MNACVSEPISWLRLERYRLNELPAAEHADIERHLHACSACSACAAQLNAEVELPSLPLAVKGAVVARVRAARVTHLRRLAFAGVALTAAAALLLVLRPFAPGLEPPRRTLAVKGGELAIGLVRERAGNIARDPSAFAAGDRFKVLLTCPPTMQPFVDVVVFQSGHAFFPLHATRIEQCGNALPLPGAFALDGTTDALVCAIASEHNELQRTALETKGRAALPKLSVCETLKPAR
jgi:hypothetical protein